MDTLYSLFMLWDIDHTVSRERLVDEVLFQLYTRIGICRKVHPHDLKDYMTVWAEWRKYLPKIKD